MLFLLLLPVMLTAARRGHSSLMALLRLRRQRLRLRLSFGLALFFGVCRCFLFLIHLFLFLQILLLRPASLPAILPVTDKEIETIRLDLHAWLEAYAQIAVVHLVLFDIGVKKVEVAGNGEKKVVMVRWQFREFVFQHLRSGGGPRILLSDLRLRFFRKKLIGDFSQPCLEQRTNRVDIIQIGLFK